MAREYKVENALTAAVEASGGVCEKHVNTGHRGDPDRLCSWPWGYHCMVETKWAAGEHPEQHQMRRHVFYREHGLDVWVACDQPDIDRVIRYALGTAPLSEDRNPLFAGPPSSDVGRRPRIGEDRDHAIRVRSSKDGRVKLLSGLGPGA